MKPSRRKVKRLRRVIVTKSIIVGGYGYVGIPFVPDRLRGRRVRIVAEILEP